MNIFVNTKTIQNRDAAASMNAEADAMLKEYSTRAELVAREVTHRLRSEA